MKLLKEVVCAVAALLATGALSGCHRSEQVYDPAMNAPTVTAATPAAPGARQPAPVSRPRATTPHAPADGSVTEGSIADSSIAEPKGKPDSIEIVLASWYGPPYHHRRGADGSIFDQNALTAAHRELPMGTIVRVTNLATGQSVLARISDRGPFIPGRTLDLSMAAAKAIGIYRTGVAKVRVEAWDRPGADPEGRWCVQVGTFIDPQDAIQLRNDLASRYTTAKVIEFAGPTGHWVRINPPLPNHAAAQKIADAIHLPDAEPYLVRTN